MHFTEKQIKEKAFQLKEQCSKDIDKVKEEEAPSWHDIPHQNYINSWLLLRLAEQSLMVEYLNEWLSKVANQANDVDNKINGQIMRGRA